jgi:alpha-ketoglutarate-dependent taurine dioxygenase
MGESTARSVVERDGTDGAVAELVASGDVRTWRNTDGVPPLFVEPRSDTLASVSDFCDWLERNIQTLNDVVAAEGAVVLRGFPVRDAVEFNKVVQVLGPWDDDYAGGATFRSQINGSVYEATRFSSDLKIGMHQEMNYLPEAPGRLAFFCADPADRGGETVIADMRAFTRQLSSEHRDRFAALGTRVIRNFVAPPTDGSTEAGGLHPDQRSWVTAFYTDDREEVERICEHKSLTPTWHDDGSLTVETSFPILAAHPRTGELVYRGAVHFHPDDYAQAANVPEEARRELATLKARQRIPTGFMLGDGSVLTPEERSELARRLDALETYWPWQAGDLMIVDNLLVAHGRNPYEGTRDVQVALLS